MRVNAYDKLPETPLEEWVTYLKTGMVKEDTRTPGLRRVREKLRLLSMTQEERRAYDRHMDNTMVQNDVLDNARDEGRVEGRAEGRTEEKLEIARNLISIGLADDVIIQSTGISTEQLASLRSKLSSDN